MNSAKVRLRTVALNPCYSDLANTASIGEHMLCQQPLLSQLFEPISYVYHDGHSSYGFLVSLCLWDIIQPVQ